MGVTDRLSGRRLPDARRRSERTIADVVEFPQYEKVQTDRDRPQLGNKNDPIDDKKPVGGARVISHAPVREKRSGAGRVHA
jgi:hypothetical protein